MKLATLLTVLIPVVIAAPATALTPYVSGALRYDVAFPHYSLQSLTSSGWLHDFGCWGSEFDVGVCWPSYSLYLGYHFAASPVYGELNGVDNAWRERRVLLGARWHMNAESRYPVLPTVGVALSRGESTLVWDDWMNPAGRGQHRKSVNVGAMIELGFLIQTGSGLDLSILSQAHRFETAFGNDGNPSTPDRLVVLMPGWQLALRYRFPEIR